LFNDNNNGSLELLKGQQLEQIQGKFVQLNFPNVQTLVVSFKNPLRGGYIDNILQLKSKNHYDYIKECFFLGKISG
jgi:hypothetical protein